MSIISRSSFMPIPFLAETSANMVSPPHSSDTSPYSVNDCLIFLGSAVGRSILFMATIMGTFAAFAWFIASTVCGITPSSAATTRTTISVTFAPLALMAVNASCPGVSRNVISPFSRCTWYAPICCVMPPASPAATFVFLMASRSEVLPWSTWPMTVTTGALWFSSPCSVVVSSRSRSSCGAIFSTSYPKSVATNVAASASMN